MTTKNFRHGLFFVLFANLCLSTSPTVAKFGFRAKLPPVPQLAYRFLVASAILWLVFFFFRRSALRIDKQGLIHCFWVALANCASMSCFYIALTYVHVSIATVLFSLYPVFVLVILGLSGEKFPPKTIPRCLLALVGVFFLVGPAGKKSLLGAGLSLLTAMIYAVHLSLVQWKLREYETKTITLYIVSWMTLQMTAVMLVVQPTAPNFSATGWGVILWTGVISTAIARFAMFSGVKHLGSAQLSLLGPTEIVMSVLWASLFLNEELSLFQAVGGLIVIASVFMIQRDKKNKTQAPDSNKSS